MAVAGCRLLLLLVPALCLCEATVYYVRPTESTSTSSCPAGQECLTLSEYFTNNYFKSNTVFRFLPGTHNMDRPLYLRNLYNVTLEAALPHSDVQPLIMAQLACNDSLLIFLINENKFFHDASDCSAIFILDSHDLTIKGIKVHSNVDWKIVKLETKKLWLTFVAGEISFYNASNVLLQDVVATRGIFINRAVNVAITDCLFGYINNSEPLCDYFLYPSYDTSTFYGVFMRYTDSSLYPSNDMFYGVFMRYTDNVVISNITVANAIIDGIYLLEANHVQIQDSTTLYILSGSALHLERVSNTHVNSSILRQCDHAFHTIFLESVNYTRIDGVADSTSTGSIFLQNCIEVTFVELSMENLKGDTYRVDIYSCTNVTFQNSIFTDFAASRDVHTDTISLPSVVFILYSHGIHFNDCLFARNHRTCISSKASEFTFSGKVKFYENTSPSGAAIIIAQKSNLTLAEDCNAFFVDNHAVSTGGAIHIITGEDISDTSRNQWCFLHVTGKREHPRLTFRGNTAGKGGDILYGGRLAIGLNGVTKNCLQSFRNISNISQNSLSAIASESSRVCLCNSSGIPDCLKLVYPKRHVIYPGQTINTSVVTVGQAFGSVAGSVFAQFIQLSPNDSIPQLEEWQYTQAVGKDSCNILNYTVFQSHDGLSDAILALTPQFKEVSYFLSNEREKWTIKQYILWTQINASFTPFPKKILEYPAYVNVTLLPCPLGFELCGSTAKCKCNDLLQRLTGVECDIQDETITRGGSIWVGIEKDWNGTLVASEYCPLNYCNTESQSIRLHLGEYDSQCNYEHSGILCGECREGLSLALGSSQCLSCSNWYLILTIPFAMAGVGLVFFIKLLDFTISHGTINGLIFYANIVKANEFIFLPQKETNPLTIFIAWVNLDLGIETCFWNGLSAYSKTWLQFLFPVYIWAIAGGIIILSKHSSRLATLMGSNSVSVLATLFFLSYAKLLRTIIVGLSYTVIDSSEGRKAMWSADGNLEYLGPYHAPLFAVCIAALLLLWLPYTLLLFCGQWLYKCNCRPMIKLLVKIKPFLDAHYGPLKGNHRYWFGAQLLVRAIILLISSTVPANSSSAVAFSVSVSSVLLTGLSSLGFYQSKLVSIFELSFFVNLALLGLSAFFTTTMGGNPTIAAYVHIGVAFVQFSGLVIYHFSFIFKARQALLSCFDWLHRKQRFGLVEEDDWELYETAALERENEAREASLQEDRKSVESVDSHPTY